MTGPGRSLRALCGSARTTYGDLLDFLRRPSLEPRLTPGTPAWARLAWLGLLTFGVAAVFGLVSLPLILSGDARPAGGLEALTEPLVTVVVAVMVLGPLVEEVVFRGWLDGRWRSIAGAAVFAAIWFGGVAIWPLFAFGDMAMAATLGLAGLALAGMTLAARTVVATWGSERRVPSASRVFPWAFWGQGLVFGLLHMVNVESGSPVLPLLAAAPTIACGWIWGYARLAHGLGAAWLLHAAYNAPAVAALLLITGAG